VASAIGFVVRLRRAQRPWGTSAEPSRRVHLRTWAVCRPAAWGVYHVTLYADLCHRAGKTPHVFR